VKRLRLSALTLSALLQFSPLVRLALADAGAVLSPVVAVLRWLAGAAAVGGAFHTVSAATGLTLTQGTNTITSIKGTNGLTLTGSRTLIQSADYGPAVSYEFANLPQGLKGSQQGVITGTPTRTGSFTASVTGFEKPNLGGNSFGTTFPVSITDQAPFITVPPTDQTVDAGASVTFRVTATGTNLKYRWLKNDIELPQAVATNDTYTIAIAKATDAGAYKVRLSNSASTVISTPVTLTVRAAAPTVTVSPGALAVHEGEAASFTAQVTGSGPFAYQWSQGTQPLPPATNATLAFPATALADAGSYTVVVNTPGAGATSGPVTLSVSARPLLRRLQLTGPTTADLTTTSLSNRSYTLESAPDVATPIWQTEQTQQAAGATLTFTNVSLTPPARFWRIRVAPLTP
jgi:hypothetical protein